MDRHDVWCLSTLILLDLFSTQSPIDEGDGRPALMTIRNVCLPVRQTNRANIQQLYNACAIFDEAAEVEEEEIVLRIPARTYPHTCVHTYVGIHYMCT